MTIEIKNVPIVPQRKKKADAGYDDFLRAVRDCQPGQSFTIERVPAHFLTVLYASRILLGKTFITRKEGAGVRIGCVTVS